jgi:hypothetical protein
MHKGILAGRHEVAQARIVAAAVTAVALAGLDQTLLDDLHAAQQEKRADVRSMAELEAIAPIIEALAEPAVVDVTAIEAVDARYLTQVDILEIPGLTKTSKEAITAYFANLERDAPAD